MTQYKYILASSKKFHRDIYNQLIATESDSWFYVNSPDELDSLLDEVTPRYIFFLHWNWVVPKRIWCSFECVCFHMTDVPYGRGGSPLQNLILNGHVDTKLTALRMIDELDAGPVYTKKTMSLKGSAQQILVNAANISLGIIKWIVSNNPEPSPQSGYVVAFKRRTPAQSALPKFGSLVNIYDFIRMLDAEGYPNAFLEYGDFVIEFAGAETGFDELTCQAKIRYKDKK